MLVILDVPRIPPGEVTHHGVAFAGDFAAPEIFENDHGMVQILYNGYIRLYIPHKHSHKFRPTIPKFTEYHQVIKRGLLEEFPSSMIFPARNLHLVLGVSSLLRLISRR